MRSRELDQRDLAKMAPFDTAHSLGRNSGSFSFREVWVARLGAPAVNASHETKRSDKVAQRCALGRGSLDHHPLSHHEKKTNMDENSRLRDDEFD